MRELVGDMLIGRDLPHPQARRRLASLNFQFDPPFQNLTPPLRQYPSHFLQFLRIGATVGVIIVSSFSTCLTISFLRIIELFEANYESTAQKCCS